MDGNKTNYSQPVNKKRWPQVQSKQQQISFIVGKYSRKRTTSLVGRTEIDIKKRLEYVFLQSSFILSTDKSMLGTCVL